MPSSSLASSAVSAVALPLINSSPNDAHCRHPSSLPILFLGLLHIAGRLSNAFGRSSFVVRSFVVRSFVVRSFVVRRSSFVVRRSSFVVRRSSFVVASSFVVRRSSFVVRPSSLQRRRMYGCTFHNVHFMYISIVHA